MDPMGLPPGTATDRQANAVFEPTPTLMAYTQTV
jgi:hypothetical protein